MNLRRNIRKVLNENLQTKFIKIIDEIGIVKASQYVGFHQLKKYLGDTPEFKQKIIEGIIDYVVEEHNSWLNLNDSGESFLFEKNSEGIEEQIEYLSNDVVTVVIYQFINQSIAGWDYLDEYDLDYQNVPLPHLEHILKLIINNKI